MYSSAGKPGRCSVVIDNGPAADLGHGPQQGELGFEVVEVGDDLEDALARRADGPGDAEQLVARRREARGVPPVGRLVGHGPRRAESEGAGLDGLGGQPAHAVDLGGSRHLGDGRRPGRP